MAAVLTLLCLGLLIAAALNWRRDRWVAGFFIVCALLNAGAAGHMIVSRGADALDLQEDRGDTPPDWI